MKEKDKKRNAKEAKLLDAMANLVKLVN